MGPDSDRDPSSVPQVLELDHVFEGLAHPHRRYLLYTLLEDTEWSLDELATKIAAWENGVSEGRPSEEEIEHIYVSLYHNHVPKLVDDDVIVFERETETITAGPNAEQVLAVLENAGGSTDSRLQEHARGEQNEGWS